MFSAQIPNAQLLKIVEEFLMTASLNGGRVPGVSRGFNFLGVLNNCGTRPLALKMFLVVNSVNCI